MRSLLSCRVCRTAAFEVATVRRLTEKLTPCDTRCTVAAVSPARLILAALAALSLVAAGAGPAAARPASAQKSGRPNILVVMTDDQAAADLAQMPNVRKLLAAQGTKFTNAVDSFPLCCPSRATFITGQYAHNHGVVGNFYPYGWYGMKGRGETPPGRPQKGGHPPG